MTLPLVSRECWCSPRNIGAASLSLSPFPRRGPNPPSSPLRGPSPAGSVVPRRVPGAPPASLPPHFAPPYAPLPHPVNASSTPAVDWRPFLRGLTITVSGTGGEAVRGSGGGRAPGGGRGGPCDRGEGP